MGHGRNVIPKKWSGGHGPPARQSRWQLVRGLFSYQSENSKKIQTNWEKFGPILGTVAALREQKDHATLLRALLKIIKLYPDLRLILIGDGHLGGFLRRLAKDLKLQQNIIFLGNRKDVAGLLKTIDLFVLPSLYEGLPL